MRTTQLTATIFLLIILASAGFGQPKSGDGSSDTAEGCLPCEERAKQMNQRYEAPGVYIEYYYLRGFRGFREFMITDVSRIEEELDIRLLVNAQSIIDGSSLEKYRHRLSALDKRTVRLPALVIGNIVLQGRREIRGKLRDLVPQQFELVMSGKTETPLSSGRVAGDGNLNPLPVLVAGPVDGVRPLSLMAVVVLLSCLALAGLDRRAVLQVGLPYGAAVFATYIVQGAGLLRTLRPAPTLPTLALVLCWILVGTFVALAAMSFFDARRLHHTSHGRVKALVMAGGALAIGFLVSVFELSYSITAHGPPSTYVESTGAGMGDIPLLLLYNAGFIVPLAAALSLSFIAARSWELATFYDSQAARVRFALPGIFLLLAVLAALGLLL